MTNLLSTRKSDNFGVPGAFEKDVLGGYGSPADGYTLVLGKGADETAIAESLTRGLPKGTRADLTFLEGLAPTHVYRSVWQDLEKGTWWAGPGVPNFSYDFDAATRTIELTVSGNVDVTTAANLERLGRGVLKVSHGTFARL